MSLECKAMLFVMVEVKIKKCSKVGEVVRVLKYTCREYLGTH